MPRPQGPWRHLTLPRHAPQPRETRRLLETLLDGSDCDASGTVAVGSDTSSGTITIAADPKPTLTSPMSGSFGLWLKDTATNAWVRITPVGGTISAEADKTRCTYTWSVTRPAAGYKLWVYNDAANGTTVLGSAVSAGTITLTGPYAGEDVPQHARGSTPRR